MPNMTIMAPKNRYELKAMIDFSVDFDAPLAIRFPKGKASEVYNENLAPIEWGKSEVLVKGSKVAILLMNCIEWLPIYFGILKTGAMVVPLNYRNAADEIKYWRKMLQNAKIYKRRLLNT